MRIGIYIPSNTSPNDGGSFGYYSQLLKTILNTQTQHQFVILGTKSSIENFKKNNILSNDLAVINIASSSDLQLFLLRLFSRLFSLFFLKNINAFLNNKISDRYAAIFKDKKINFIYNLVPGEYLTLDIPYITTVWDVGYKNVNQFPEVSGHTEYMKRDSKYNLLLSRASLIAVESEAGKNDVIFYFRIKPEKIIVIPLFPGNVIEYVISDEEQKQWLQSKNITPKSFIFYPAQFWAHKNHINLLKALSILKQKFEISFLLILTGSNKGNWNYIKKKIIEYNLQDQVQYLGLISEQELTILYKNAYALVMPTFLGPTTMPVLEAISLSCPVICSNFEGHKEQLNNAALYFSPNNPNEIAEKIKLLITTPELRTTLIHNGNSIISSGKNSVQNSVHLLLEAFNNFENIRDCWE